MNRLETIKRQLKEHKPALMQRYGLSSLAVFGSYARNEQTETSDVDILVEFSRPIGLAFIDLAEELESILSVKVDLVSRNGLKEWHFQAIEKELHDV